MESSTTFFLYEITILGFPVFIVTPLKRDACTISQEILHCFLWWDGKSTWLLNFLKILRVTVWQYLITPVIEFFLKQEQTLQISVQQNIS